MFSEFDAKNCSNEHHKLLEPISILKFFAHFQFMMYPSAYKNGLLKLLVLLKNKKLNIGNI